MATYNPDYKSAVAMQRHIVARIEKEHATLKPGEFAALVGAWNTLTERKRIIKMVPAPAPVDILKMRELKHMQKQLTQGPDFARPVGEVIEA